MLSLSLSLPSLRGCLKLPSLTLFTFSLFYRYQEEMAWNPAVFRTLDKLHSHSKWIYMNKEADTWRQRVRWDNSRWGKKVQKEGGPLKCIERTRWMQRQGGVGKTDVHCKWDEMRLWWFVGCIKWALRDWQRSSDPLHVINTPLAYLITATDLIVFTIQWTGGIKFKR